MNLSGNVVIISGASAGIGAALAQYLAAHGAYLILIGRRLEALNTTKQLLAQSERHCVVAGDIADRAVMDRAVAIAMSTYGKVDLILCNAGVGLSAPVASMTREDLQACINTNVYGVLNMIQAILPIFRIQGKGHIAVISSVVGVQGLPYSGGYCATKGAVERLCDALRIELLESGITLSVVRPGTVNSEFLTRRHGSAREKRSSSVRGISATTAAERIMKGIVNQQRYVYTRWQDRVMLWGSQIFAPVADRILARTIRWEE